MSEVSPGKLTQIIGAIVVLLFSFLPWYSGFGYSVNAWGTGLFPMASWAPIFALAVGFIVAARAFKFLVLPEKVWEFTMDQVVLVLSVFALLIPLSYLIASHPGSLGFGLFLCFLGAIAMVAGFFMDRANVGVNPNAGAPGYNAPMQPGQEFPPAGQPQAPVPGQAAPQQPQQPFPGQPAPQQPQQPPYPGQTAPQQPQGQPQYPQQPQPQEQPYPGAPQQPGPGSF